MSRLRKAERREAELPPEALQNPERYLVFPEHCMRAGALVLTLSTGLLVLGLWAVPAGGADETEDDPFPVRRVLLSPERLSAALEQSRQGVFVKLPLTEFEDRLRRARQALRAAPRGPLLAEASYKASLVEAATGNDVGPRGHVEPYLTGRGQWKLHHRGPDPALLPLRPLSLVLAQPRFENREALVGDFDAEGP